MTAARGSPGWDMYSSSAALPSFVAGEELADIADHRDDILVLGADMRTSNRTDDFARRHPTRYFDLGIAEQNMVSVAAGLASCGYIPYVSTFASFLGLLCLEHLRTDLAYTRMPVRLLAHHSGIALGFYGTSHHAVEDIATTRAIANLTVVAPCDANSLRALLRGTVDLAGPVYFRMGRGRDTPVYDAPPNIEPGRFVRVRDGHDMTIIATGSCVALAIAAAESLANEGVSSRVYDAAYLKPLDEVAILDAARSTGCILAVEEHNHVGGLGSAVGDVLARGGIAIPFAVQGLPDEYMLVGPPSHLYRHYGLTADGVAQHSRSLLTRK